MPAAPATVVSCPVLIRSGVLALAVWSCAPASAQDQEGPREFAITVYSSAQPGQLDTEQLARHGQALPGHALVRDQRRVALSKGRSEVRFTDVAARMDPTTVAFESLTDPDGTRVIEQNYQFDLVSGEKLLQRYIGQPIAVEQTRGESIHTIEGELLSASNGLTLRMATGEIATLNSWTGIRFPSLPGGLIARPTLVWLVEAGRGGTHTVRVSYQARAMTWWADYNLVLDESKGCAFDLGAWVTLVNQSGASYPDARLKLVAGEVNRAPKPQMQMVTGRRIVAESMAMADEGFQESSLFEYHLYTLGRRTDLPDNSTKQIELFPSAAEVRCAKQLVFTAAPDARAYWGSPNLDQGYAATASGEAGAYLSFDNREQVGLGMPLPAGRVRVNQLDSADGSLEFIGEDVIRHTPRNETIRIRLGTSFDVVGERRQTAFRADTSAKWIEESFEIEVRNRKEEAVELVVREYLYRWSDWRITSESTGHVKRDQQTIDFPLTIAADSEARVTYTVRYTW